MNNLITTADYLESVVKHNKFAVLATDNVGQPHVSLVAITRFGNFRQLIFATYRNTLKYRNLSKNNKVALLIENKDADLKDPKGSTVLTIIGDTEEITNEEHESAYWTHLKRHPEMESFMLSPDCALILVIARSFQVVNGIDKIEWISANDLDDVLL
jgi:heme iron utilization protein